MAEAARATAARATAAGNAPAPPDGARGEPRRYSLGTVLVAGSLGALAMFGALAATGIVTDVTVASTPTTVRAVAASSLVATAANGVVAVRVGDEDGTRTAAGIVVGRKGDVVTTLDLGSDADRSRRITVQTAADRWTTATALGSDPVTGLTVVRLDGDPTTTPATVASPELGTWVHMVRPENTAVATSAAGADLTRVTSTSATITATDGSGHRRVGLTTLTSPRRTSALEVALDPSEAAVVGLVVPLDDNPEDEMSYAVPADLAVRVGRQIALDGDAEHGRLDCTLASGGSGNVVVTGAANPDAGALQPGDEVVSINGRPTHSTIDVEAALLGMGANEEVTVVVRRDHRQTALRVPVAPAPPDVVDLMPSSTTSFP